MVRATLCGGEAYDMLLLVCLRVVLLEDAAESGGRVRALQQVVWLET